MTAAGDRPGVGRALLVGSILGLLDGLAYFLAAAGLLAWYVFRASRASVSDNVGVLLGLPVLVFIVFPLVVAPLSAIEILLVGKRRPDLRLLYLVPPLILFPLVGLAAIILSYFPLLVWFSKRLGP